MTVGKLVWQALVVAGLVSMLLGAADPLEGSVLIVVGSGLIALGVWLGRLPQRSLFTSAFMLVVMGVGAMIALSAYGGIGGKSGHTLGWLLTVLPYPVGWLMGLAGVMALVGAGWQRSLIGLAVFLSVTSLGTLILLCALRQAGPGAVLGAWMPWLILVPHALGLVAALVGGILWIVQSRRAAAT